MNLFFYAGEKSIQAKQFTELLLSKDALSSLTVLPAGAKLNSDHSLKLRNGDVMILFAANDSELQHLLTMHDKFEEFRVILILQDHTTETVSMSHTLKPRYVTFAESNITNLEKVISKMQSQTEGPEYYS